MCPGTALDVNRHKVLENLLTMDMAACLCCFDMPVPGAKPDPHSIHDAEISG